MLETIGQHVFHNEYEPKPVKPDDYVILLEGQKISLCHESLPTFEDVAKDYDIYDDTLQFMFRMDEHACFLCNGIVEAKDPYIYKGRNEIKEPWIKYAYAVSLHLDAFYKRHTYCGCCGQKLTHSLQEQALVCTCGATFYPEIMPAIICAVIDGDRIVLTKYNRKHAHYALVAGYVEFGEKVEETVKREVYEETGLRIKEITYVGSQPWPFSQSIMLAFTAKLDGDDTIHRQESELSEARWFYRHEIPEVTNFDGLTQNMIQWFKEGKLG